MALDGILVVLMIHLLAGPRIIKYTIGRSLARVKKVDGEPIGMLPLRDPGVRRCQC